MIGFLRLSIRLAALTFVGGVAVIVAVGADPTMDDRRLKATFLLNFAKFVSWPESSFSRPDAPIVIAILGDDPFGDLLEKTLGDQRISGRGFQVTRLAGEQIPARCHMLFVGRSERDRLGAVFKRVEGRPVLTIGETAEFCRKGGMINFENLAGRVKVEINPAEAGAAGLRVSSKLLSVSKVVQSTSK